MTNYHAFREIGVRTPAAIIEMGFLKADRELLTEQPQQAADGIVDGILCFLTTPAACATTPSE
jgi:N-acetylmuramoyl-L-alanine amidase